MAPKDEVSSSGGGVIALLTDFGLSDPYAGVMKGVILSRAPEAKVVDLTHGVPPQAVSEAAFLLETAWPFFPPGTIFLVVVDPGVGSTRRRLALQAHGMTFIGPDNGCLSAALNDLLRGVRPLNQPYVAHSVLLDASVTAVSIENEAVFLAPVSTTFEGRDVFAPVAGHVAAGGSIAELGSRLQQIQAFPAFRAPRVDGRLNGLVVHIDTYGNLITDIPAEDVEEGVRFAVRGTEAALIRTYADGAPGRLVAIAGSSGFIEIAEPSGSAATKLHAAAGDAVVELP